MSRQRKLSNSTQPILRGLVCALCSILFFFAVCLCSAGTVKKASIVLIVLALSAAFLFWERLRERFQPPILALALVVLIDTVSIAYAASAKFALYETMKVICAFCLALLLLVIQGKERPERGAAAVLEGFCAIAGLVSIDMLSTRWISTPVLSLLGLFTADYTDLEVVEEGVRMISVFMTPNVFAGCIGIGVLLSLGLASTAGSQGERAVHLVCLSVNSLSFILAFSMGACAAIVLAFVVLLALAGKERRIGLLLLMVETLAVTALCAFPISLTSMTAWDGVRPVPLLCTVAGAAALCALELLVGRRLCAKLAGHEKMTLCFAGALAAALAVFLIAACTLTTGVTLQGGESLRRSAYPKPGAYTVTTETDGEVTVSIQSQNRAEAMMHTSSELYNGPLSQAAFTVPEDSMVVWFQFWTPDGVRLERVEYSGEGGSGSVPLSYRLLPAFMANRIQGLLANQNAIQRFVFFEDGLKIFLRSPVLGLGMGAFENGVRSVQSFRYDTKYAHNHYIQALAETGLVGLALFLGLLAVSALAVWKTRREPLAPALGAALAFMAVHGAVEVVFSTYPYLPAAFGVIAAISLCGGGAVPRPAWAEKKGVKNALLLGCCALLAVFGIMLGCNIAALGMVDASPELSTLEKAAALDPFEKADYMLSYVVRVTGTLPDEDVRETADGYAERLEDIPSNIIPYYLAAYYLDSGRTEEGLEQAERYVTYVSASADAWRDTFRLLAYFEQDTDAYRAGVAHIADLLDAWNEENMGHITLDEDVQAFVDRMRAPK